MDPFDVFPVKVWEEILHRLEPQDKLNLIETNHSLEMLDLFQDMESEWQFTSVLGILLDHLYRIQKRSNPFLVKHYHPKGELKSAFLNCRLVSKSVNRIVDNFVDWYWKKHFWFPPFASPSHLHLSEHVDMCLAQADQLKRNNRSISPFISGGLLDLDCGETWNYDKDRNVVWSGLTFEQNARLVSHPNIGNNLRGIRLAVHLTVDEIRECNLVRKLLHFTPNVLHLGIHFYPSEIPEIEVEQVDKTPLPELPHLNILSVYEYNYNDTNMYPLLQAYLDFRQYSEQLTSFRITLFLWKEEYKSVKFPKLKSLLFFNVIIRPECQDGMKEVLLEVITNVNAPALEHLTLETDDFELPVIEPEDAFFMQFLKEQFLCKMLQSRPDQKWGLDRRIEQDEGIFNCVYVFTKDG